MRHRRNAVVQPPAELVKFDTDEWAAPDDESWLQAFQRWKTARRQWVKTHGTDTELGDMVDVLYGEKQVRRWRANT